MLREVNKPQLVGFCLSDGIMGDYVSLHLLYVPDCLQQICITFIIRKRELILKTDIQKEGKIAYQYLKS